MPLLQFLFLLSAWKRSLSKRIKRDGNIETIKCKNGANLKSWSYYHAIVLVNLLNLPKYVIILKQLINPLAPNDVYMSYRTANLQMLHFKYLLNKYTY